jgi:hypothetical protein
MLERLFGKEQKSGRRLYSDESSRLATNSFVIIGFLMLLGIVFILFFSVSQGANWNQVLSVIALVMLASFAVGAILGFIFGIPRTLQGDSETIVKKTSNEDGSSVEQRSNVEIGGWVKANTNLEQLSDWLTKIIVGVGLVEFKQIASSISGLSEKLSEGISLPESGFAIISATIVFYLLMGFLICYLWTRIYFEKILKSQLDDERLNKLEKGKEVLEGKLIQLEQNKNWQEDYSELKKTFRIDKARELVHNMLEKAENTKEQTAYFQEIIRIAFDKKDYYAINELAKEFNTKITISATSWADVAIANMDMYNSSNNLEDYKSSIYACNRSTAMLADYGVPYMIRIYLELINYKLAKSSNRLEKELEARNLIVEIVNELMAKPLVAGYEAYNYFLINASWSDYNKIFQTEFESEYNLIYQKYQEYTKK